MAVAGLTPHTGEHGLLGTEETDEQVEIVGGRLLVTYKKKRGTMVKDSFSPQLRREENGSRR